MVASGSSHGYVRLLMDLVNAIDNLVTGNATLEEFWKVRPARRAIFFVYSENFAYFELFPQLSYKPFSFNRSTLESDRCTTATFVTTLGNPTRNLEESTSLGPHILAHIARP